MKGSIRDVDTRGTFQRARRPEQVQERRAAIPATARDLLALPAAASGLPRDGLLRPQPIAVTITDTLLAVAAPGH